MDWLIGSTSTSDAAGGVENTPQEDSRYAKDASKDSITSAPADADQIPRSRWFSDVGKLFSTDSAGLERAERNTSSPLTPYQELIALCEGDKEEITVTALSTAIEACLNRALVDGEINTVLIACGLNTHTKVLRPAALKALWSASLEAYLIGLSHVGGTVGASPSSPGAQTVQGCKVMVDVHRLCALPEAERIKAKSAKNSPEPKGQLSAEPPVLGSGLPSSPLLLTPTATSPGLMASSHGSPEGAFSSMSPPKSVSAMLSELSAALPMEALNASSEENDPNAAVFSSGSLAAAEVSHDAAPSSGSAMVIEASSGSTTKAVSGAPAPTTTVEMSRTQLIRAKYEENEKVCLDARARCSFILTMNYLSIDFHF